MTISLLRFKLRLKSERFTESVTIITERFKVLFDMSDIGHSRVLSKSQLFTFSAPLLLGVMSYTTVLGHHLACLWRSPLLQRGVGENRPGVMQIYKFSFLKT